MTTSVFEKIKKEKPLGPEIHIGSDKLSGFLRTGPQGSII